MDMPYYVLYLSNHQLMDIWTVPTFLIIRDNAAKNIHIQGLCGYMFSFFFSIHTAGS